MGSLQLFLNRPILFSSAVDIRCLSHAYACLSVDVQSKDSVKVCLKSQEVMETSGKVIVGTYARTPLVLSSAKGYKLYDLGGREYLDYTFGIVVNSLDHVRAVTKQVQLLTHTSNVYYLIPQVELAKRLVDSSDRVFFSNSEIEANEAAIKFARKFQKVSHSNEKNIKCKVDEKHRTTEHVNSTGETKKSS